MANWLTGCKPCLITWLDRYVASLDGPETLLPRDLLTDDPECNERSNTQEHENANENTVNGQLFVPFLFSGAFSCDLRF